MIQKKAVSVGIVGTAKNTGKTTALSAILSDSIKKNMNFAVTSIGYDGEAFDNLTLLPKPRMHIEKGQIAATAEHCCRWAEAQLSICEKTGIDCGLGEVFIAKADKEGKVVIAGPNKHKPLNKLLIRLSEYSEKILVDGALGRIAPFSITDAIIFSTGAARNTRIDILLKEMLCINSIFAMPESERRTKSGYDSDEDASGISIELTNGDTIKINSASVLSEEDTLLLSEAMSGKDIRAIFIPGAIAHNPFFAFLEKSGRQLKDKELIFLSAPTLLSGWDPIPLCNLLDTARASGIRLCLARKQKILAITVNPFYPMRVHRGSRYTPAFINTDELKKAFTDSFSIPIIDIFKDGATGLINTVKSL